VPLVALACGGEYESLLRAAGAELVASPADLAALSHLLADRVGNRG
jgi:hypothetical protein